MIRANLNIPNSNDCANSTTTQHSLDSCFSLHTSNVNCLLLSVTRPETTILWENTQVAAHLSVYSLLFAPFQCLQTPLDIKSSILMRVFRRQIRLPPMAKNAIDFLFSIGFLDSNYPGNRMMVINTVIVAMIGYLVRFRGNCIITRANRTH